MDAIYERLIKAGLRTIEDVEPEELRQRVQLRLEKED